MSTLPSLSKNQESEVIDLEDKASVAERLEDSPIIPTSISGSRHSIHSGRTVRLSDELSIREDGAANENEISLPPVDRGFGAWSFVSHV
jgi:hypothetical protein